MLPAVLHIRDFIDHKRPLLSNHLLSEHPALFHIYTQVRFFADPSLSSRLGLEAFVFAWGSFLTCTNSWRFSCTPIPSSGEFPPSNPDVDLYQEHYPGRANPLSSFSRTAAYYTTYRMRVTVYSSSIIMRSPVHTSITPGGGRIFPSSLLTGVYKIFLRRCGHGFFKTSGREIQIVNAEKGRMEELEVISKTLLSGVVRMEKKAIVLWSFLSFPHLLIAVVCACAEKSVTSL